MCSVKMENYLLLLFHTLSPSNWPYFSRTSVPLLHCVPQILLSSSIVYYLLNYVSLTLHYMCSIIQKLYFLSKDGSCLLTQHFSCDIWPNTSLCNTFSWINLCGLNPTCFLELHILAITDHNSAFPTYTFLPSIQRITGWYTLQKINKTVIHVQSIYVKQPNKP